MRCGAKSLCNLQQLFGLDVSVSEQVSLEIGSLVETSLTYRAAMGSLFKMENLVDSQCSVLTKPLAAVITLERFLLGMDVSMVPEHEKIVKFNLLEKKSFFTSNDPVV